MYWQKKKLDYNILIPPPRKIQNIMNAATMADSSLKTILKMF